MDARDEVLQRIDARQAEWLTLLSDLVRIVLLVFFPVISLYLVHTFK